MLKLDEKTPTRRAALAGLAAAAVTTVASAGLRSDPVNAASLRTDEGFTSLQRAVDASTANDELQIQRAWSVKAPVRVNKPLTIRGVGGGSVTTTKDVHAFEITSSGVHLIDLRVLGSGAAAGTQSLIRADGTARAPLKGLIMRGCTLTRSRKNGIELHHASGFTIERNSIRDIAYAGILIFSGTGGRIVGNRIVNIVQPKGFVNSYGIALTRSWDRPMSTAPRTTGTLVSGNLVDGVTKWEGIDTHAGVNVTIISNTVRNAYVGIAVVPCRDTTGVIRYAPTGMSIKDNTVDSGVKDGTTRAGIQLVGARHLNRVTEYAQGVISGNTIIGCGYQDSANGAGVLLSNTRKSTVEDNVLKESSVNAVLALRNNVDLSISGNTMIDTWTNDSTFTACIHVGSVNQSVKVSKNKAGRVAKKANKVNDRGIFICPTAKRPDVNVTASGNDFTACERPLAYPANWQ